MTDDTNLAALEPVERPLSLIPVGLKEAALDSPTFRATALHFSDHIDAVERWLEGFIKAAAKLVAETAALEAAVSSYLVHTAPPQLVSEAVLDHDYSILALRRYNDGAREYWNAMLRGTKRTDVVAVEPIKAFLANELRGFKDSRRALDATQKTFDHVISRYLGQNKTKEASSLREDAFQLHEARKAYLKASMDFCVAAPNLRASLDKLLVRVFAELWKDMRTGREANDVLFTRTSAEMERVRGWSREMENSERAFKRELQSARKQIEDSAAQMTKPSRDMDHYAASTVPYLGTGASAVAGPSNATEKSEKQGWLFLRTVAGKPARAVWSRRWFFVKNGIFGWLVQGTRSGGVEESEKIGVLLCSIRPWFQEERRFCFEVKTKDTSIILQAETQQELADWISAFEFAKRKALEDPSSTQSSTHAGIDAAFAISPPVAPELTAKVNDGQNANDEGLIVPAVEGNTLARQSTDVGKRITNEKDQESSVSREHAARIIQKLDLSKRLPVSPSQPSPMTPAAGIASLISASHYAFPVGPGSPATPGIEGPRRTMTMPIPTTSLAPATLANPPAPTNLSHAAVLVNADRDLLPGRGDGTGTPSGIMANLWGSSNWGYVNRLGSSDSAKPRLPANSSSPTFPPSMTQDDVVVMDGMGEEKPNHKPLIASPTLSVNHRKTRSETVAEETPSSMAFRPRQTTERNEYPSLYPPQLKAQHAQFQALFPEAPRAEKLVLVFRATWNPTEQQEFPGRVYVTTKEIYFYSNHLGLVLITGVPLDNLIEVTAAPGRDCDFLYLHLRQGKETESRRITVKVFLEPLRLLQRRMDYLVQNANSDSPEEIEDVLKALIRMETEVLQRSSSVDSWEDIEFVPDEGSMGLGDTDIRARQRNVKTSLRIDGNLFGDTTTIKTGREVLKFKLPSQPVVYAPQGMQASVTRDFNISAKALFHVMFGDKSAVFQLLYVNRWADKITQTPWIKSSNSPSQPSSTRWTRSFESNSVVTDTQTIDILNDHLCYVVTNLKHSSRLPYAARFRQMTKIVITHTAKSRCKLAIFQRITWHAPPSLTYVKHLIEVQSLNSLEADALDVTNVAMDQVSRLGNHSKTNRAIDIFGNIGQHSETASIDPTTTISKTASLPKPQAPRKAFGLGRLIINDVFVRILALLGWVLDIAMALSKNVIGVCTAHSLLLTLLLVSVMWNTWHEYRDGVLWWRERGAAHFMTRLGVGPSPSMTKAVYLADIESLVQPPLSSVWDDGNTTFGGDMQAQTKTCRSTFLDHLAISTSSLSEAVFSSENSDIATKRTSSSRRFQRTRAALASYRHDLLVAMRVVNRVEKDVVSAEWESWVQGEAERCILVKQMFQRQNPHGKDTPSLEAELGEDFVHYCRGCQADVEALKVNNQTRLI
ncbi:Hypothetical protein R9X50_00127600 [Acrodontium crateriforme]|uniref:Transcription factor SipA3 n=1 Tax=Acrodontium crateriforme TaxID=150365 RepID=A0AAQ3R7S3_9PEZI|nr:Hypothetical protein R9X50_00127600 [Acrodontium crateriforme]